MLAERVAREITYNFKRHKHMAVIGPNPAVLSRLKGLYRWQIVIGCTRVSEVHEIMKKIIPGIEKKWGKSVQIQIDVDPMNLF